MPLGHKADRELKYNKKWMKPLGQFANFYRGRGKDKGWKFKSLIGEKNAMVMSGNFGFTLLKETLGVVIINLLGKGIDTEMRCAELCYASHNASSFVTAKRSWSAIKN